MAPLEAERTGGQGAASLSGVHRGKAIAAEDRQTCSGVLVPAFGFLRLGVVHSQTRLGTAGKVEIEFVAHDETARGYRLHISVPPVFLVPGRGDALTTSSKIQESLVLTREFVKSTYESVAKIAHSGGDLKEAMQACREFCDKIFAKYAIYEHCLPFNVSRAFDEAKGIDNPRIWTAERDKEMWNLLQ